MKILNYKYLNEQSVYDQARSASKATGISQKDMRRLVGANLGREARIDKIPTVNAFRGLGFSFVEKQGYDSFINSTARPRNLSLLKVSNSLLYTFAILYEGDSCYLYPYTRQSLTLDTLKYVKSYLKLDLSSRLNPNTVENVQQYFSQFNPKRSDENEFNVKNYTLTVGSNFDEINRKYGIPLEVQNLKDYVNPPVPMYLSINSVSKEYLINTVYGEKQERYQTLDIDFRPTRIQGFSAGTANSEPYLSFNNTFTNFTQLRSTVQNTNRNLGQNLVRQFPYMSIFSPKNSPKTFIIYTDRPIKDYLVVNQRVKCIIGRNVNEFYAAEMLVNEVN